MHSPNIVGLSLKNIKMADSFTFVIALFQYTSHSKNWIILHGDNARLVSCTFGRISLNTLIPRKFPHTLTKSVN